MSKPRIPLLLLLLLLLLRLVQALTVAVALANSSCPESSSCGGIDVPYPFGLTHDCAAPGFLLSCNATTTGAGRLFIDSGHGDAIPVTNISLAEGLLFATTPVIVLDDFESPVDYKYWQWPYTLPDGGPFAISDDRNMLTAIGCDALAMLANTDDGSYFGLCGALCMTNKTILNKVNSPVNGSCSGVGCCQTSFPDGIKSFVIYASILNPISNQMPKPSSQKVKAFVVDKKWFNFSTAFFSDDHMNNATVVPFVIEWAFPNATCADIVGNASIGECRSENSVCLDTGNGYRCNCNVGYSGNPYFPNGCQVDSGMELCPGMICVTGEMIFHAPGNCTCVYTEHKNVLWIVIGVGIGVGLLLLLASVPLVLRAYRSRQIKTLKARNTRKNRLLLQERLLDAYEKTTKFPLSELERATESFDESRLLGGGGHGSVYKGILRDLRVVAVKRSNLTSKDEIGDFVNEVVLLSQVEHRNVVRLIGCCLETEVPLLVYEFVSNGTLSYHLHDPCRGAELTWPVRLRIAAEAAAALAYLHTHASICIYHRDVKSANVLLDDALTAKVSDFGGSRSVSRDKTTHQEFSKVQGTFGYWDPEYYNTGQLTEKSDVYSFGVILAEMLTGERPVIDGSGGGAPGGLVALRNYFLTSLKEGRLLAILQHGLLEGREDYREQVEAVAMLAESCLNTMGEKRPAMKDVELRLQFLMRSASTTCSPAYGSPTNCAAAGARGEDVVPADDVGGAAAVTMTWGGNSETKSISLSLDYWPR